MIKRPMLASDSEDLTQLSYPLIASPKIDGIRCLKIGGRVLARSLKPIPNKHIRELLEKVLPDGADGEVVAGDNFQEVTSGVMSADGTPRFTFNMFDFLRDPNALEREYRHRLKDMLEWAKDADAEAHKWVEVLPVTVVHDAAQLQALFDAHLAAGHEGTMVRDPTGPYKEGRSTLREGWLLKVKQFVDSEAEITGFHEMLHNTNEATINELGYTQRSGAKAGKVPAGILGKLEMRDIHDGREFRIGTGKGLTFALRKEIWENREAWMGRIIKYKYQKHGQKDKPRIPIWQGPRDPLDMSKE